MTDIALDFIIDSTMYNLTLIFRYFLVSLFSHEQSNQTTQRNIRRKLLLLGGSEQQVALLKEIFFYFCAPLLGRMDSLVDLLGRQMETGKAGLNERLDSLVYKLHHSLLTCWTVHSPSFHFHIPAFTLTALSSGLLSIVLIVQSLDSN